MKKLILYTAAVLLTVYMALIYRSQLLAGTGRGGDTDPSALSASGMADGPEAECPDLRDDAGGGEKSENQAEDLCGEPAAGSGGKRGSGDPLLEQVSEPAVSDAGADPGGRRRKKRVFLSVRQPSLRKPDLSDPRDPELGTI